jgi:hypothetical protein
MSRTRDNKYQHGVELYNEGMSVQAVADFYGITRQAMWKILARRGVIFRSNKQYGESNNFFRGTRASDYAQNALEYALRKGFVERKYACEKCGATPVFRDGRTGIQAHHPDYNKPLEVVWLCQRCHHEWHKFNIPIGRKEAV